MIWIIIQYNNLNNLHMAWLWFIYVLNVTSHAFYINQYQIDKTANIKYFQAVHFNLSRGTVLVFFRINKFKHWQKAAAAPL